MVCSCAAINMSNPPLKSRVRVERVYFYSELEGAVVWHETGKNTHLNEGEDEMLKQGFHFSLRFLSK